MITLILLLFIFRWILHYNVCIQILFFFILFQFLAIGFSVLFFVIGKFGYMIASRFIAVSIIPLSLSLFIKKKLFTLYFSCVNKYMYFFLFWKYFSMNRVYIYIFFKYLMLVYSKRKGWCYSHLLLNISHINQWPWKYCFNHFYLFVKVKHRSLWKAIMGKSIY